MVADAFSRAQGTPQYDVPVMHMQFLAEKNRISFEETLANYMRSCKAETFLEAELDLIFKNYPGFQQLKKECNERPVPKDNYDNPISFHKEVLDTMLNALNWHRFHDYEIPT